MYLLFLVPVIILLDQLTKQLIISGFEPGDYITAIKGVLDIRYVRNTGAAYSTFEGKTGFLVVFTAVFMAAIILYFVKYRKEMNLGEKIGIVSIIGGGLGNMIDRIFRSFVVDFLDIHIIPVFNVADIFVTCGAAAVVIAVLLAEKKKKTDE